MYFHSPEIIVLGTFVFRSNFFLQIMQAQMNDKYILSRYFQELTLCLCAKVIFRHATQTSWFVIIVCTRFSAFPSVRLYAQIRRAKCIFCPRRALTIQTPSAAGAAFVLVRFIAWLWRRWWRVQVFLQLFSSWCILFSIDVPSQHASFIARICSIVLRVL